VFDWKRDTLCLTGARGHFVLQEQGYIIVVGVTVRTRTNIAQICIKYVHAQYLGVHWIVCA